MGTCVCSSFGSRIWKSGIRFSGMQPPEGVPWEPATVSPWAGCRFGWVHRGSAGKNFRNSRGFPAGRPDIPAGHVPGELPAMPPAGRDACQLATSPRGCFPRIRRSVQRPPVPRPCSRGSTLATCPPGPRGAPPRPLAQRRTLSPVQRPAVVGTRHVSPGELPRIRAASSVPRRGRVQRVGAAFNVPGSAGFEVWPAGNVPGELPRPFRVVPLTRKNHGAQAFAALHPAGA